MKKMRMKIIMILATVLSFATLNGCGSYYIPADGGVFVTAVDVSPAYTFNDRITFEIKWNNVFTNNIDLWLITPMGGLVADGGPEVDGCYFLGTYQDSSSYHSQIECLEPYWGNYKLHIENIGSFTETTTTDITWEHNDGWDITNSFFQEETAIGGGDAVIITYSY